MDIADLKQSISQMTDEELLSHLRGIRTERRARANVARSASKKKPKSPSLPKDLSKISKEDALELLKMLGEA